MSARLGFNRMLRYPTCRPLLRHHTASLDPFCPHQGFCIHVKVKWLRQTAPSQAPLLSREWADELRDDN